MGKIKLKDRVKDTAIKGATKALPRLPRVGLDLIVKRIRKQMVKYFEENPDGFEKRQSRYVKSFVLKAIDVYLAHSKRLSPNCRYKLVNNLGISVLQETRVRQEKFEKEVGFKPPALLVLSPTMRCNLRCTGCYAFEYNKTSEGDIPYDVLERTLQEAKDMGIAFMVITGGEPFMRKDELLKLFKKFNDMFFIVYTNGTFINEKLAADLEKVGNVVPCISVEGYKDETDQRRGGGVHDSVLKAMKNLREKGVPFTISVTVTRENEELVTTEEFLNFYIEQGVLFAWYFQYMPVGRDPNLDLMVTAEQRNHCRKRILTMRESDMKILPVDFWGDAYLSEGCIAGGINYLHISGTGWIEPCVFVHFAVDNIKDTTVREALQSTFMKSYRDRQTKNTNRFLPCGIIDHPENLRGAIQDAKDAGENVRETHPGAGQVVNELAPELDRLAEEKKNIIGKDWDDEKSA